jgi:hypothetical protein
MTEMLSDPDRTAHPLSGDSTLPESVIRLEDEAPAEQAPVQ